MAAVAEGRAQAPAKTRSFYVWIAGISILVAFLGFVPTYFAPLASGKLHVNPIVHIHGVVFFAWTLFYFYQTSLVSADQVARHRAVGMAGISLVTLMTMLTLLTALNSLTGATGAGFGPAAESFLILPMLGAPTFAGFFATAIANIRRPKVHKRLMLLTMVSMLEAPLARPFLAFVFRDLPPGPPPVWVAIPAALISDLLIVAAMIYDRRTRGAVHPVYWIGGGLMLLIQLGRLPLSATAGWHGFMQAFGSLAGAMPPG